MINKTGENLLKEMEEHAGADDRRWELLHKRFLNTYKTSLGEWSGYDYIVSWLNAKMHIAKALTKPHTPMKVSDASAYGTIEKHMREKLTEVEKEGDQPRLSEKKVIDKIITWRNNKRK